MRDHKDMMLRGIVRDLEDHNQTHYRPGIEKAGGTGRYFVEGIGAGLFFVALICLAVLVMVFKG